MKKYEVMVQFTTFQTFVVYAKDSYDAKDRAFEEAEIYLSESHQYADDIDVVDVYTEEEED